MELRSTFVNLHQNTWLYSANNVKYCNNFNKSQQCFSTYSRYYIIVWVHNKTMWVQFIWSGNLTASRLCNSENAKCNHGKFTFVTTGSYRFFKYISKMCNKKLFQGHHRTLAVLANESESVLIKQLSNISICINWFF